MDSSHKNGRPTLALIDRAAFRRNIGRVRRLVSDSVRLIAVLKADAYGHGALALAPEAVSAGADMLAVATLEEAAELRQAGIETPLLLLTALLPEQACACLELQLTPAVCSLEFAEALDRVSALAGTQAGVHLKIDSGMGRLGFASEEISSLAAELKSLKHLRLDGLFSHPASADTEGPEKRTAEQLNLFLQCCRRLTAADDSGHRPLRHLANSAALLRYPSTHLEAVRPGICLYGGIACSGAPEAMAFEPVLSLVSHIVSLRRFPGNRPISYGGTYTTAAGGETIAVLPVGYADGLSRGLSNKGHVLVNGKFAAIVGRVCMDQTMINVSGIEGVQPGSRAVIIGSDAGQRIRADDLASWSGTIVHEALCVLGGRIPRLYHN